MLAIPDVVRNRALAANAHDWLDGLPALVREIERDWSIEVGPACTDATEAVVAHATLHDGTPAVLKLVVPRAGDAVHNEITALRLAGDGSCARLLHDDVGRGALLLERLGRPLSELGRPLGERLDILTTIAARVWRPAPDCGLPTGAAKGRWLIDHITTTWEALDRPCSERAVTHAVACAARRIDAHDDERAVLVHGDVHQWNALEADDEFRLIDPDGLLAEAEYDLGILMREDPVELLDGDPFDRAHRLAARCDLDPVAVWEWGVVERVSTGLSGTQVGLQPVAGQMLAAAEALAAEASIH